MPIPENSVIYCDIPYKWTNEYTYKINYDLFYKWAKAHGAYVSEYNMPPEFEIVAEFSKICTFSKTNNAKKTIERVFR